MVSQSVHEVLSCIPLYDFPCYFEVGFKTIWIHVENIQDWAETCPFLKSSQEYICPQIAVQCTVNQWVLQYLGSHVSTQDGSRFTPKQMRTRGAR